MTIIIEHGVFGEAQIIEEVADKAAYKLRLREMLEAAKAKGYGFVEAYIQPAHMRLAAKYVIAIKGEGLDRQIIRYGDITNEQYAAYLSKAMSEQASAS